MIALTSSLEVSSSIPYFLFTPLGFLMVGDGTSLCLLLLHHLQVYDYCLDVFYFSNKICSIGG